MAGSMQITGLASGLDVNSIVEKLMDIEKQPLNRILEKKIETEYQKEYVSEINTRVYDFQASVFDMTLESSFKSKKTTSSNEDAIGAVAGLEAVNGTYTFRNVTLASSTVVSSTGQLNTSSIISSSSAVSGIDTTKSFEDAGFSATPDGAVVINGVSFTLSHYSSVDDFMQAVEDHSEADISDFSYNVSTETFSITADTGNTVALFDDIESGEQGFLEAINMKFIDKDAKLEDINTDTSITSGIFSINGVDFNVSTSVDSIQDIVDRINSSDAGVTAFYDEYSEKFTLKAKDEGNTEIVLEDKSTNFLEAMKIKDATQSLGTNASFEFNGIATTRSSNTFEINGIEFNLKEDTAGPVSIAVESDTEDVSKKVQDFVDKYNEVMTYLYNVINEDEASDEQKSSATTQEELKQLEKQGLLNGNNTIRMVHDQMKDFLATTFAGYTLEDIGISPAGAGGTVTEEMKIGMIEFDKEKFEQAMQDMPDVAEAMLRANGSTNKIKSQVVASADGSKQKFYLGYKNIGQDVSIKIDGTEYKLAANPSAADEFSIDRDTGYIEFFSPPPAGDIEATFDYWEGQTFDELEKTIGSGNGYRTTFSLGNDNIKQNVSVVVGDGSNVYTQVESEDELTGYTYLVDHDKGTIKFGNAPALGEDVKVSYEYMMADEGAFYQIYEGLKTYTGIGIFFQEESSLTSTISDYADRAVSLQDRLDSKEERLWKQYTNLETTLNNLQSQSSWLSGELAKLG